ncbi:MAG: hypothetical protein RIR69_1832, partial [Actinomycetota bacterium]
MKTHRDTVRAASLLRSGVGATESERRLAHRVSIAVTFIFLCVVTSWRPHRLFTFGGFSSNFYDAQAAAFLRGELHVPADVAGIEGFLIDGKTYLYYGPFLSIARLPTALFGSWADGRVTRLSMIIGFYVMCCLLFRLVVQLRQVMNVDVVDSERWRPAFFIVVVATSPVLSLGGDTSVYYETELWAFVFLLLTFTSLLAFITSPTQRNALIVVLAVLITVHTRASIGFGALAALVLTGIYFWNRDRKWTYASLSASLAVFATHVALNYAKFGTLLNLPGEKQVLTLLDPNRAQWFADHNNSFFSLSFFPTTLFHYLRPDAFALERLVPFVRFGAEAREVGVDLESYTPSSSLTVSATAVLLLACAGLVQLLKKRNWLLMSFLVGGLVAALPTLAIGFIAQRYLVDLLPVFVVLAALAVITI